MMSFIPSAGTREIVGLALTNTLWQAALLLGGLRLVLRWMPVSASHARHRAAMAAGCLVLLTWGGSTLWLLGDWRDHERCWEEVVPSAPLPPICREHGRAAFTADGMATTPSLTDRANLVARWLARPVFDYVPKVAGQAIRASAATLGMFTVIWGAVLLLAALGFLWKLASLRRLRRTAEPVAEEEALRALRSVVKRAGVRRTVELRSSAAVSTPGVAGWRRPTILLPDGLVESLDDGELRVLLAHEVAHVRAGDFAAGLMQSVAEHILFFNPFARAVSRTISLEREAARDRSALFMERCAPRRYGELLLALEGWRGLQRVPHGLVPAVAEGSLLRRIRRLVDAAESPRRGTWIVGLTAALLVAITLAEATAIVGSIDTSAVMRTNRRPPTTTPVQTSSIRLSDSAPNP